MGFASCLSIAMADVKAIGAVAIRTSWRSSLNDRYGRTKDNLIERDFPHRVEKPVREGLRQKLGRNVRMAPGAGHSSSARSQPARGEYRDYVAWCFVGAETTKAFSAEFTIR